MTAALASTFGRFDDDADFGVRYRDRRIKIWIVVEKLQKRINAPSRCSAPRRPPYWNHLGRADPSYRQKSAEEIRLCTVPPITDATPRARVDRLERVGIAITAVLQPRIVEDEFAHRGANVGSLRSAVGKLVFYDTWLQHGGDSDPNSFKTIYSRTRRSVGDRRHCAEPDFLRAFFDDTKRGPARPK